MSDKSSYNVIGLMSGTSVDGLDIALISFTIAEDGAHSFEIKHCETIAYPVILKKSLLESISLSGEKLSFLDLNFGEFCGNAVLSFLKSKNISNQEIDIIASHGHTVFHQPQKKLTLQIGCGQTIASITGIKVVNDFRTKDVLLGGQGAPLVPIGDHTLLKGLADSYLNLGGFSNISLKKDKIIAFDICPVGVVLNKLMQNNFDLDYDKAGSIGRDCGVNNSILDQLNDLPYYSTGLPKSLGLEALEEFWRILNLEKDPKIKLGTAYEHIATQISKSLNEHNCKSVVITGGGAFNDFLIKSVKSKFEGEVILPNNELIEFKEALIFAYLGVLRIKNKTNILAEVTGAKTDSSSGVIYLP